MNQEDKTIPDTTDIDENLDDLHKIDLVMKDGRLLVRSGQIVIPRHVPAALPKPAPPSDVR